MMAISDPIYLARTAFRINRAQARARPGGPRGGESDADFFTDAAAAWRTGDRPPAGLLSKVERVETARRERWFRRRR
jgi:hypothetical protein